MSINENLEKLSNACGVTGREYQVRKLLMQLLEPYTDEIFLDKLENVVAIKKGNSNSKKIMLAAHMDEIGLMVKSITKDGFVKFAKIGGIDDRILQAQKITIHTKEGDFTGVISSKPPHVQREEERKKVIRHDELFIDIGADSKDEADSKGVAIGDAISFQIKYENIGKNIAIGKAFDNRAGCATMVETLKLIQETDYTVCAVGTVQEEVGLRGAATAAFGVDPDLALALDVTTTGDVPGMKESETSIKIGGGPAITISDAGLITPPKILRWLTQTAEQEKIPFQLEAGLPGSTDAARIALSRQGIPSGTVSIPTRYIHSPIGLLNLQDIEYAARLATSAIEKITSYF